MTKATHTIDGQTYCGELAISPAQIVLSNYTLGACSGPQPEPPGRLRQGRITWGVNESVSLNVDLTKWENVYGRAGNAPAQLFPGPTSTTSGPAIWLPTNQYVALEFVATGRAGLFGSYLQGNLPFGPPSDVVISTTPGDFTIGIPGEPGSIHTSGAVQLGEAVMRWMINPANHNVSYCHLNVGQKYFLNIRFHNAASLPLGTQPIYLQHNHN